MTLTTEPCLSLRDPEPPCCPECDEELDLFVQDKLGYITERWLCLTCKRVYVLDEIRAAAADYAAELREP